MRASSASTGAASVSQDESPTMRTVVAARVRIAPAETDLSRPEPHCNLPTSFLTALTKARISAALFRPGVVSTPEETSTPNGCTARIASRTFAGVRPPAGTIGLMLAAVSSRSPVDRDAGSSSARMVRRVEQRQHR
jgi:hypothetical protein